MEFLETLLLENPTVELIDLSHKNITQISTILPILQKFSNLRSLSLESNNLKSISSIGVLTNLESLNVNNNSFDNFESAVLEIASISKLRSLIISLESNEQVYLILDKIPLLCELNEKPISEQDRKDMIQEEPDEETKIPHLDSAEKYPTISVNQVDENEPYMPEEKDGHQDINECADSPEHNYAVPLPQQHPSQSYQIDNQNISPDDNAKQNIPDNNKEIGYIQSPEKDQNLNIMQSLEIKAGDLDEAAVLYDKVRELRKKESPSTDKKLACDFENSIRDTMEKLKAQLQADSKYTKTESIIFAKYKLTEISLLKVTEHIKAQIPQAGEILETVNGKINSIINEYHKLCNSQNMIPAQIISEEGVNSNQKLSSSKATINEAEFESLKERIDELEKENKKYFDQIVKHSKESVFLATNKLSITSSQFKEEKNSVTLDNVNRSKNSPKKSLIATQRSLTLKQLKDTIEDIYIQKEKYDQKCIKEKLPRETMEAYLYAYLEQKYGLKQLVLEWYAAVINGLKLFAQQDTEIALFGKVLQNECDEEFRFVQTQVKNAMGDLLRDIIKRKFKNKGEESIQKMMKDYMAGYVSEAIWYEIVRKMYNDEHFGILEQRIRDYITESNNKLIKSSENLSKMQIARIEKCSKIFNIKFADLQRILLDFQLKSHEKYLKKFIILFKSIDGDTNGVINDDELISLLNLMNLGIPEDEITKIVSLIDPHENHKITFSEVLAMLSLQKLPNDKISMLDRFITMNEAE